MKAFVTSVGEVTTDLCVWSLKRNGFEVVLINDSSSLASKLIQIYKEAKEDFVRVDADVIPNRNLTPKALKDAPAHLWWVQYLTYDWYKQDTTHGGVQFIRKAALDILNKHAEEAINKERPESYLYRLEGFHNPRRCDFEPIIMGLHNYRNDTERVYDTKSRRGQIENYDFELAMEIEAL